MTTSSYASLAQRRLKEAIEELTKDGWTVTPEPHAQQLPSQLMSRQIDFIAHRGSEILIGEVASRRTAKNRQIDSLAALVEQIPNARLEVYWLGDSDVTKPDEAQLERYISEARSIVTSSPRAGLLMALAALEGAISSFADSVGVTIQAPSRQLLANLSGLGLIDTADYSRLSQLYKLRSGISHSLTAEQPDIEDIYFVINIAERMAQGRYTSADKMIDWFLENFEDPAHRMPHDSREGGYFYTEEGPFDAEDVLREEFPDASDQAITEAVNFLEHQATDWVRQPGRRG
jgi:predicted DNA-binding protein